MYTVHFKHTALKTETPLSQKSNFMSTVDLNKNKISIHFRTQEKKILEKILNWTWKRMDIRQHLFPTFHCANYSDKVILIVQLLLNETREFVI